MREVLANMYAVMATIPFISFVIIYVIMRLLQRDKRTAAAWSMNITTFFLISSVTVMYGLISKPESASFFWWLLFFWLLVSGGLAVLQVKVKGELNIPRVTRTTWRLTFVVLTVAYVVFFWIGLQQFMEMT